MSGRQYVFTDGSTFVEAPSLIHVVHRVQDRHPVRNPGFAGEKNVFGANRQVESVPVGVFDTGLKVHITFPIDKQAYGQRQSTAVSPTQKPRDRYSDAQTTSGHQGLGMYYEFSYHDLPSSRYSPQSGPITPV